MKTILALGLAMAWAAGSLTAGSIYDIPLKSIDDKNTSLKAYKGQVLLIVNVASKCGLTPQYKALQAVHAKFKQKGFTVLGFPCNDFAGQEPGSHEDIKTFCESNYQVTFPLFAKLHVKGPDQHPLYATLTGKDSPYPGDIAWNFGKFIVGRDGKILKRFEPKTTPDAPEVIAAIESALAGK
jgi:glutathione peroxidase